MGDCPICYDKLGRVYRTLSCGHKFHHKCLKLSENDSRYYCPYCRLEYNNMILRSQILSEKDQEIKDIFVKKIKNLINNVLSKEEKNSKLLILIQIYEVCLNNIFILNTKKFKMDKFLDIFKKKSKELEEECITELNNNFLKKKDVNKFLNYKKKILKLLI